VLGESIRNRIAYYARGDLQGLPRSGTDYEQGITKDQRKMVYMGIDWGGKPT